jgi:hypothetical protein
MAWEDIVVISLFYQKTKTQQWHTFFSFKKNFIQIKAGQNNKYDITKTSGLVQVCLDINK